jgi:hypothetical protein
MATDKTFVEKGSYKGKPTLSIKKGADDRFPFSFGEMKARLLLAHIDDIKAFVAECEAKGDK